jgi:protein-tyrosine-phosphatase
MRSKSALIVGLALLVAGSVGFAMRSQPVEDARGPAEVVFVCKNGVSMSVWAAAYFNQLASARGLRERAVARATIPSYTAVPFRMVFALAVDGFRLDGFRPRVVSPVDVHEATHVVIVRGTDDTVLPPDAQAEVRETEVWEGFPPMREDYFPSRQALRARVEDLVERVASS